MKKTKILIAEDASITLMDLWHIFELWGYEMCEQVTSGEKAVEDAEKEKPDVVVMDINLAGKMSGIEAAKQIRSGLDIPVIFITGYSDPKTREAAKVVGPAGYFIKPLDYYKLRSAIEAAVNNGNVNDAQE